jgi:hypothetical protein
VNAYDNTEQSITVVALDGKGGYQGKRRVELHDATVNKSEGAEVARQFKIKSLSPPEMGFFV